MIFTGVPEHTKGIVALCLIVFCASCDLHPLTKPECGYMIPKEYTMVYSDKTNEYAIYEQNGSFRTSFGINSFRWNINAHLVVSKDSCIIKSLLHGYLNSEPNFHTLAQSETK